MTEEQKYLLKNGCDDLVINEESRPEDWIYVSDIMQRWKEQQLTLTDVSHQRELCEGNCGMNYCNENGCVNNKPDVGEPKTPEHCG
jgi:hypothetical protein